MFAWLKTICRWFQTPRRHEELKAQEDGVMSAALKQPVYKEEPPPGESLAEPPLTEHEKRLAAQKLKFRKRAARHEAAHVIVGDAISEDMEWVNVDGKPGEKDTKTRFNYSPESRQILDEQWDGITNRHKMTQKVIDLAVCFVAGHLIEDEKYNTETVSQM